MNDKLAVNFVSVSKPKDENSPHPSDWGANRDGVNSGANRAAAST
jgi:hypothetical protein